jgi:hypothetical protein
MGRERNSPVIRLETGLEKQGKTLKLLETKLDILQLLFDVHKF